MGDQELLLREEGDYRSKNIDEVELQNTTSSSDRCNLIVNYLPQEFDDHDLTNLFHEHGDIVVVKVVRDKISKKSLGYGFVKYANTESAIDAIERKNGLILGDKKIKVSFARPSTDEIKNCKLYITNLPKEYIDQDVFKLFSQFGSIIECRVLQDRQTKSNRGVAFVQFSNRNEANNALSLNGYRLNDLDRTIIVKYAEDQQKKKERSKSNNGYDVSIAPLKTVYEMEDQYYYDNVPRGIHNNNNNGNYNIDDPGFFYSNDIQQRRNYMYTKAPNISNNGVQSTIARHPNVDSWYQASSIVPPHTQMSYDNSIRTPSFNNVHINQYVQSMHPSHSNGHNSPTVMKSASLDHTDQAVSNSSTVTLVITNLPAHADVATLHDLISPYGRILNAQVDVLDSTGLCSGRGQVQMGNISQAQYCVQALSGTILSEAGQPLQIFLYGGQQHANNQQERQPHFNHNFQYNR